MEGVLLVGDPALGEIGLGVVDQQHIRRGPVGPEGVSFCQLLQPSYFPEQVRLIPPALFAIDASG